MKIDLKKLLKIKKYSLKKYYGKDQLMYLVLGISIAFSILLFLLGFLTFLEIYILPKNMISAMDFLVFGVLSIIGPIGFYNHLKIKKKEEIEKRLPDVLREISSSTSSGMTVFDSIKSVAKGDHGRLTPELEKMAAQISWGIPVNKALNNFAERINTDSIKRVVITINKALQIGGNTSAVFEAAAREIDQKKMVERQRKSEMSMYSTVIFISFFVFLAVILIINGTIFKEIFAVAEKMPSGGGIGGSQIDLSGINKEMLHNSFFAFVMVQSIGGGLLGGFMMDGRLSSGVRYGFILVLISFFVFKFMF
ncbi:MAG: type II secretion system F family protein [Candidatus Thermoplasmatota archaeon]